MRFTAWLLLPMPLAIAGCGDDMHHGRGDHAGDGYRCGSGVTITLASLALNHASDLPLAIQACFDKSCDNVVVSRGSLCTGKEGGPPDQLTSCAIGADGTVKIGIVRVDGADYSDGKPHVVGVSVMRADGSRLFSHVETPVLAAYGDGCFAATVSPGVP